MPPPVDDHPISEKVRFSEWPKSICHSKPRDIACRQVGQKVLGRWVPLPDCVGCDPAVAVRDWEYIVKSRNDIDQEFA